MTAPRIDNREDSSVLRLVVAAILVTAVSACGEPLGVSRQALNGSDLDLHPNSERYRISGEPHATGRSGSATMVVRALASKHGPTELYAEAGSIFAWRAPMATLLKLRLVTFDSEGEIAAVRHEAPGAHSVTLSAPELAPGARFEAKGHIVGTDYRRTDIVVLESTVKLRPDLEVESIDVPAETAPHTPVTVAALVSERNGETGATADCVLRVDGELADRAAGIWIDAGGAVSCVFHVEFEEEGTHLFEVSLENVDPWDDDMSNNSASGVIEVVNPVKLTWQANARTVAKRTISISEVTNESGVPLKIKQTTTTNDEQRWDGETRLLGGINVPVTFPASVTLSEATDGTALSDVALTNLAGGTPLRVWSNGVSMMRTCAQKFVYGANVSLTLCSLVANDGTGQTTLDYRRSGGEVTYFSSQFIQQWITNPDGSKTLTGQWSTNTPGSSSKTGAPRWELGSTFDFALDVTSADKTYSADASLPVTATPELTETPRSCTWYSTGIAKVTTCRSGSVTTLTRAAVGVSQ